ncbi:H-2 class I histocompatibility antigen, alpha chain-like [Macrotis lagotis]|uniref:H-2 class I histocompatibility antigen, alpha chain-like n=1 Tax=Macrotis lagotis TaxID=92651 RepID=UPI003D68FB88
MGGVTLQSQAQDSYPSEISLTWLKHGEEQLQDTELIEIRPGGDGTFQKWATVWVLPVQEESYISQVQHQGLVEPLSLKWGGTGGSYDQAAESPGKTQPLNLVTGPTGKGSWKNTPWSHAEEIPPKFCSHLLSPPSSPSTANFWAVEICICLTHL